MGACGGIALALGGKDGDDLMSSSNDDTESIARCAECDHPILLAELLELEVAP